MPDFQYIAREATGRQVSGLLTAVSKQDALSLLAGKSLFPVSIDLAKDAKAQRAGGGRVRARYLCVFYTQLGDLLHSGVPLLRSLELLEAGEDVLTDERINESASRAIQELEELLCPTKPSNEES